MKIAKKKFEHIKYTGKERMWAALNKTVNTNMWPEMQVIRLKIVSNTRKIAAGWTIETVEL